MNLVTTPLDTLINFLDNGKGVFWNDGSQITEGRNIATGFKIVNTYGDVLETNALQVAQLHHLLAAVEPTEHPQHPIDVLNSIWMSVKGVSLIADIESVTAFQINLLEDKIEVAVTDRTGGVMAVSVSCGVAIRLLTLKAFCSISPEMAAGLGAWPGRTTITFDVESGALSITGVQPVAAPEAVPAIPAKKPVAAKAPVKKPVAAKAPAKKPVAAKK